MIDWHCHILPSVDDGPADIQQSIAMASSLSAYGFRTVHCTPHMIRGCYEASNNLIREKVHELQEQIWDAGISLEVLQGREYYLDEYLLTSLEDPITLGNSRQVLVEIPSHATRDMIRQLTYSVVRMGLMPVIAHPERCSLLEPIDLFKNDRGLLSKLKSLSRLDRITRKKDSEPITFGNPLLDYLIELGCSFQGNLGSFRGYYGVRTRRVAEAFRDMVVYDRYGSDLHALNQIPEILGTAS